MMGNAIMLKAIGQFTEIIPENEIRSTQAFANFVQSSAPEGSSHAIFYNDSFTKEVNNCLSCGAVHIIRGEVCIAIIRWRDGMFGATATLSSNTSCVVLAGSSVRVLYI